VIFLRQDASLQIRDTSGNYERIVVGYLYWPSAVHPITNPDPPVLIPLEWGPRMPLFLSTSRFAAQDRSITYTAIWFIWTDLRTPGYFICIRVHTVRGKL